MRTPLGGAVAPGGRRALPRLGRCRALPAEALQPCRRQGGLRRRLQPGRGPAAQLCVRVCVCVSECACVRACVRAFSCVRFRACARACVRLRACVRVRARVRACVFVRACDCVVSRRLGSLWGAATTWWPRPRRASSSASSASLERPGPARPGPARTAPERLGWDDADKRPPGRWAGNGPRTLCQPGRAGPSAEAAGSGPGSFESSRFSSFAEFCRAYASLSESFRVVCRPGAFESSSESLDCNIRCPPSGSEALDSEPIRVTVVPSRPGPAQCGPSLRTAG